MHSFISQNLPEWLRDAGGEVVLRKMEHWPIQKLSIDEICALIDSYVLIFDTLISFKLPDLVLQNAKTTAYLLKYAATLEEVDWKFAGLLTDLKVLLQIVILKDETITKWLLGLTKKMGYDKNFLLHFIVTVRENQNEKLKELRDAFVNQKGALIEINNNVKLILLYFEAFLEHSSSKLNSAFEIEKCHIGKMNNMMPQLLDIENDLKRGIKVDYLYTIVPYRMLIFAHLANYAGIEYDGSLFNEYEFLTKPSNSEVDFIKKYPFFE